MTLTLPPEIETALLDTIRAQAVESVLRDFESVRLLTRESAAALLEISPRFFDDLVKTHNIDAVRLSPRCVRYRLSDLRQISATRP